MDRTRKWLRSTIRKTRAWEPARCHSRGFSTSNRTIFAKSRPKDFFVYLRGRKFGCATATSSSASVSIRIHQPVKFANCVAPTIRKRKAVRRRAGAKRSEERRVGEECKYRRPARAQ